MQSCFPARVVPSYPCTRDLCFIDSPFSFLISCVTLSSRCRTAGWLSCARDEGLPVALSIVRLHVWDGSGRKYTCFVSRRLGEGMPSVLVLGTGKTAGLVPSSSGHIHCHLTIGQRWNTDVRSGLREGESGGDWDWEKRRRRKGVQILSWKIEANWMGKEKRRHGICFCKDKTRQGTGR